MVGDEGLVGEARAKLFSKKMVGDEGLEPPTFSV